MIDYFPINKKVHEGFFWSHGCDYKKFEKNKHIGNVKIELGLN